MGLENYQNQNHRGLLKNIAHRVMIERGLLPDFSPAALTELKKINAAAVAGDDSSIRDLRGLLWASIDNDDSLDLDQYLLQRCCRGMWSKFWWRLRM